MKEFFTEKQKDFVFEDGSHIFFTSDTHFSHDNIIRFCKRPFKDANEMNEELVRRWNEVVGPDDIVFHLGDFAWGGSQVWNDILDRLNGKIYLVLGNHDMKNLRQGYIKKFEWVGFQIYARIEGRSIYMNHYPFLSYGGVYRSGDQQVWQVFGHVHSQKNRTDYTGITDAEVKQILSEDEGRLKYLFPTQYDVGVDNNDYTPIPWSKVCSIIEQQVNEAEFNNKPWYLKIWTKLNKIFDGKD